MTKSSTIKKKRKKIKNKQTNKKYLHKNGEQNGGYQDPRGGEVGEMSFKGMNLQLVDK